jgi:hypothetical protein
MSEPSSSFLLENDEGDDIQETNTHHQMAQTKKHPPQFQKSGCPFHLLMDFASASIPDVADPAFYFRIFLDIMIFLIVMDGVRRYSAMSKERAQPESQMATTRPRISRVQQVAKDAAAASKVLNEAIRVGDVAQCAAILEEADAFLTRRILGEPDLWGCNALHLAAASGCAEIVSMLVDAGESCGSIAMRVNAVDVWDQTPLHFAARAGSVQVCKILLERGASVDAVDAQECTALHVAAKLQHEATCEFLLDQGAGVHSVSDVNIPPMLSALLVKRMLKKHPLTPLEY